MSKEDLRRYLESHRDAQVVGVVGKGGAKLIRDAGFEPHDYGFLVMGEDPIPTSGDHMLVAKRGQPNAEYPLSAECIGCGEAVRYALSDEEAAGPMAQLPLLCDICAELSPRYGRASKEKLQ